MLARTLTTISKVEKFVFYMASADGVKHLTFYDKFFDRFEKVEQIVRCILANLSV